jgi:predicted methyltransferase
MRDAIRIIAVVAMLAGCATCPGVPSAEERARAVVASPIRTDQDRRMDESRNPLAFLPFTGVRPAWSRSTCRPARATRRS